MKNTFTNTLKLIVITLMTSTCSLGSQNNTPNILLITLDDMNWDSPGCYGGIIPDLTPNIDGLASNGMLFHKAFVQAPNCSPSRSVIQTGLYPHQSGMRGFYYVEPNGNTLPEILKQNGYITGVLNKLSDSSLSPDFERYWDSNIDIKGTGKRSPNSYSKLFEGFLNKVDKNKKPFYCVVNIGDPHKPFFNDTESIKNGFDEFKPSKIYKLDDVEIPEFLPKHPKIKQEILNYYNSVKRGDDCVGAILKSLKNSKYSNNTIIILLSDHGMPLPFAKSSVYPNGIRTPLLINWEDKITQGTINKNNMVSAIDLAPTILDLVNISIPKMYAGNSFSDILLGNEMTSNQYVFTQFDENAGGIARPTRSVFDAKFGYVFNPWATGKLPFKSAADSHTSYKVMKNLSQSDSMVKTRFDYWVYRRVEEFYDYETDPNALNNLIDDPKYQDKIEELRQRLLTQMTKTDDYLLEAFKNREDFKFLDSWMETQVANANVRAKILKWKRYKNSMGSTKENTELYSLINKTYN